MEIEPIYLFDNKKELIDIVPAERLIESSQDWTLNGLIKSTVVGVYSDAIEQAHYYGTRDIDEPDVFWQYKIINYSKHDGFFTFDGIYVLFDDLSGRGIVKDKRPNKAHTTEVLGYILEGTGWQIGQVYSSKTATSNHYYISKLEAFWDFVEKWRVEFKPRMTYSGGKVTGKYIDIYDRVSDNFGKWYEYGDTLLSVEAEEMRESVFTAFVGRGKGEEVGDGFGRKIGFKDVVWTTGAGKPVNKPINQDYVEIPWATDLYGYEDGTPRMTIVDFPDIEDQAELLDATYEYALTECRPKVQFKANVLETERADVGEIVTIIRDDIGIRYKTRIFNLKRDFLNPKVKTIQFGEQLVQSRSQGAKKTATAIKKQEEQVINWLLALREAITDSYFNEDGYNYELAAGNEYGLPGGYYSFNRPIDQSPSKVVYVGAGKVLLANSKNPDGSWIWRTAMDGDGIVADEINTGTLNSIRINNKFSRGGVNGQITIDTDINMNADDGSRFNLSEKRISFSDGDYETILRKDGLDFYRNGVKHMGQRFFTFEDGSSGIRFESQHIGERALSIRGNQLLAHDGQGGRDSESHLYLSPAGGGAVVAGDATGARTVMRARAFNLNRGVGMTTYDTGDASMKINSEGFVWHWANSPDTHNPMLRMDSDAFRMYKNLDMTGRQVVNTSDKRMKRDITPTEIKGRETIRSYNFVDYYYTEDGYPEEKQFGLIAQDTPIIGSEGEDGNWTISTTKQVMLNSLVAKELDEELTRVSSLVKGQEKEINELKQELADLKSLLINRGVI